MFLGSLCFFRRFVRDVESKASQARGSATLYRSIVQTDFPHGRDCVKRKQPEDNVLLAPPPVAVVLLPPALLALLLGLALLLPLLQRLLALALALVLTH